MEIPNEIIKKIKEYYPVLWQQIKNYDDSIIKPKRYISKSNRYKILQRQNWICNQCSEKLKYDKSSTFHGEVAHIDHIHPFTKKESYPNGILNINELSNLQALCPECNLNKSDKEIH